MYQNSNVQIQDVSKYQDLPQCIVTRFYKYVNSATFRLFPYITKVLIPHCLHIGK